MAQRVLVTGASGFLGRAVCARLERAGCDVRAGVRQREANAEARAQVIETGSIGPHTDWTAALEGVHSVVHLAGRVHVWQETAENPRTEFWLVNVVGTERLARMAAQTGVRRFVFVSSIGVLGNRSGREPFRESDAPQPYDWYTESKWAAEQALNKVSRETGMETVILRPPLVYGPGMRGNLQRLLRWIYRGFPLPFGRALQPRSFLGVDNFADLIAASLTDARAANETFVAADGEDITVAELVTRLGRAMGRPATLLPLPAAVATAFLRATGRAETAARFFSPLQVDASKARRLLNWTPGVPLDEGLRHVAEWYRMLYHKHQ